ncbi:unnamed protein product [Aphanomyces euteiches]|uniref:Uncharacterized protein n=1 Tax=Aphanomyces euteiches TaxID=100861 RepID=A0A6G0W9T5_9STRA|nr:hypothetical protein Ae201684_017150 [Aphanomyces euteiches]KAH9073923.1 hypothetical protein Ae201684P_015823 [Aphanomyces euteiches]KAH9137162.1 hypothetical protein AeRB84_017966 [Aphanomyces euteiches]
MSRLTRLSVIVQSELTKTMRNVLSLCIAAAVLAFGQEQADQLVAVDLESARGLISENDYPFKYGKKFWGKGKSVETPAQEADESDETSAGRSRGGGGRGGSGGGYRGPRRDGRTGPGPYTRKPRTRTRE